MATLHERKNYREAIMKTLYESTEGNRLHGVTGAKLRDDLHILRRTWPQPAHIW
ncbi:hypothetical protein [Streptomyces sp. KR80]|uniref:hypothetical protein n=1 Tax=Streptomyces sp. KR80 TaxID=3457426 RepID=UPI003FD5CF50